MNRKQKLTKSINMAGLGLELGPLSWPLLTKEEADIRYVDHVSREELIKLYKDDPGVKPELIPTIDYSLQNRTLRETIPKNIFFDYIIASHVIEHIPDMVSWFKELASILKVGGIVSLAIPDKRYTFDIDRQPSELSAVMGAYLDKHTRPSSRTLFDYASNYRQGVDAAKVWAGDLYLTSEEAPHRYSLSQSMEKCLKNKKEYIDTHCFVFTPHSFLELVRGLIELDLFDFKIVSFDETAEHQYEFFVSFQKVAASKNKQERLESIPNLRREPYAREQLAKIAKLKGENDSLRKSLEYERSELRHVLASKSWKFTKPIRYGMRLVKKIIPR